MIKITRWKAAFILLVILGALVVDGFAWIARVTQQRASTVAATVAPSASSFTVNAGTGAAFVNGQNITVANQTGLVKAISGDTISLDKPLASIPSVGSSVTQNASLASLSHPLTSPPKLLGHETFLHKGLDIQGGTELTIAICRGPNDPPASNCRNGPANGASLSDAQAQTIPVLQQRVNGLGVSEATVQAEGADRILVELPGVSLDQAEKTLGKTAKLHFATAAPDPQGFSLQSVPPTPPACPSANASPLCAWLADQQNLYDPAQFASSGFYFPNFHWKIDDKMPANEVSNADVATDQNGQPVVSINFSGGAANEWKAITDVAFQQCLKDLQQPSGTQCGGSSPGATSAATAPAHIAIFLDNQIITAPVVTGGNQGGQTQISGLSGGLAEAQSLAQSIKSGALPSEITTVQANEVSPTLGQDTVKKTLLAGGVGLLIVILFMLTYYRFPGFLASVALVFYSVINLAVYKLAGVTVSLAGLAGFLLSVGMAVDANVLIFERTRDELRHGRGVGVAVETGFRRAFPAIRDSNVSTLIACAILYAFGNNIIRGFAATLGVGVAVSFFSAILITQSLLAGALRWRMGRNPRLYTQIHPEYEEKPPRGRFDIVRARNLYFLLSLLVIVPGIVAILFWHTGASGCCPQGFRLGLDFAGGNRIEATFTQSPTPAQIVAAIDQVDPALQPQVQDEGNKQFAIQTLPTDTAKLQRVADKLDSSFHIATQGSQKKISETQIGPTIAAELVGKAVQLVLLASAAIALYLFFAFRRQRQISPWRFSVCTFIKLLHDVFVLLGIWAILGHFSDLGQVDALFVTALLTSVAFSIHDTIVVFDRIRENLRVGARMTFDQTINLSTVQTMTRSLNTSLTVVFVLLALTLFGGASIRGFVLALLVGIVTGTYSSIFNASTLLAAWQKAQPQDAPGSGGPRRVTQRAA
ncbi:MAG: protein translocase subunit SecD [Candidatus Dormibacteria bacterium]